MGTGFSIFMLTTRWHHRIRLYSLTVAECSVFDPHPFSFCVNSVFSFLFQIYFIFSADKLYLQRQGWLAH